MTDHRLVFSAHFRRFLRNSYPSHLHQGSWITGACHMYAKATGIDIEIVIGVVNGEREPNIRMMEDLGVCEAWITEEEVVQVQRKVYRWRKGDILY